MNPIWGHIAGVITTVMLLSFVGIWIWLWLPQHKRKFDRLAHLPMQDETASFSGRGKEPTLSEASLTPPPAARARTKR